MIRLWPVVPCRSLALAWEQTSLRGQGSAFCVHCLRCVGSVLQRAGFQNVFLSQPGIQARPSWCPGQVSLELRPQPASCPELQASRVAGRV